MPCNQALLSQILLEPNRKTSSYFEKMYFEKKNWTWFTWGLNCQSNRKAMDPVYIFFISVDLYYGTFLRQLYPPQWISTPGFCICVLYLSCICVLCFCVFVSWCLWTHVLQRGGWGRSTPHNESPPLVSCRSLPKLFVPLLLPTLDGGFK